MLDQYIINARQGGEFNEKCKAYNVNWRKIVRTLHKRDSKCYYAKGMSDFIPFDTLEEAEAFQVEHNVQFRRCKNCFPNEGER